MAVRFAPIGGSGKERAKRSGSLLLCHRKGQAVSHAAMAKYPAGSPCALCKAPVTAVGVPSAVSAVTPNGYLNLCSACWDRSGGRMAALRRNSARA